MGQFYSGEATAAIRDLSETQDIGVVFCPDNMYYKVKDGSFKGRQIDCEQLYNFTVSEMSGNLEDAASKIRK